MPDGQVRLRSNVVASGGAWDLVPGELVYVHRKDLLRRENRPPPLQHEEQMYYRVCGTCQRPAHVFMREGCECPNGPTPTQLAATRETHRRGLDAVAAARQELEDELGVERDA